jgi:hypothetical protein
MILWTSDQTASISKLLEKKDANQEGFPIKLTPKPGIFTNPGDFKINNIVKLESDETYLYLQVNFSSAEIVSMATERDSLVVTITNSSYFEDQDGLLVEA